MTRDRVVSLRLSVDELDRLAAYFAAPGRSGGSLSDAVRQLVFDHIIEPARCNAVKPGTWTSSYLPVCPLPAGHLRIDHWWRDDRGNELTWPVDRR